MFTLWSKRFLPITYPLVSNSLPTLKILHSHSNIVIKFNSLALKPSSRFLTNIDQEKKKKTNSSRKISENNILKILSCEHRDSTASQDWKKKVHYVHFEFIASTGTRPTCLLKWKESRTRANLTSLLTLRKTWSKADVVDDVKFQLSWKISGFFASARGD